VQLCNVAAPRYEHWWALRFFKSKIHNQCLAILESIINYQFTKMISFFYSKPENSHFYWFNNYQFLKKIIVNFVNNYCEPHGKWLWTLKIILNFVIKRFVFTKFAIAKFVIAMFKTTKLEITKFAIAKVLIAKFVISIL